MGKIMEAIFCVAYLIVTVILGIGIIKRSKGNKEFTWYGIMTLVLVSGDAFHLVPRILAAINRAGDYHVSLGIGKMVTSITMTLFYMLMYMIYRMRYNAKNQVLMVVLVVLAAARIILCLLPQNDWTGADPVILGIYRNIPFTIMGIIMVVLYFIKRADEPFKWMWLAITLSFAFYIPVVLWSEVSPMIGMLMMPKTIMYVWIVIMGFKEAKNRLETNK